MRRILMTLIDEREDLPVSERSIKEVITMKKSS